MKNETKTNIKRRKFYKTNKQSPTKRIKRNRLTIYIMVLIVSLGLISATFKFQKDALAIDKQLLEQQVEDVRQEMVDMLKEFNVDLSKDKNDKDNLSIEEHIWYILADEYAFTFRERIQAVSVVQCESSFWDYAIGVNKNGSLDLGVWQVNEPSHGKKPGYSRACMFDVYCQTRFIVENIYIPQGRSWEAWVCWN